MLATDMSARRPLGAGRQGASADVRVAEGCGVHDALGGRSGGLVAAAGAFDFAVDEFAEIASDARLSAKGLHAEGGPGLEVDIDASHVLIHRWERLRGRRSSAGSLALTHRRRP